MAVGRGRRVGREEGDRSMNCRTCGSSRLEPVLDLGEQHLSDFRDDMDAPPTYPLRMLFCRDCYLAQLDTTVPRELMYHERYGFKSGVNGTIRANHMEIVSEAQKRHPTAKRWLDIACNDGTLLSYVKPSLFRAGVDPVAKYAEQAREHADLIVNDYFSAPAFSGEQFDVITAISVFYDLDDPNLFLEDVLRLLARGGIFVVQQNYLLDTVALNALDNVCHEHLTYFSLLALERLLEMHDLEVIDVTTTPVNGGSFRTTIARKGERAVSPSVYQQRSLELLAGLDEPMTMRWFAARATKAVEDIQVAVEEINEQHGRVFIYGASTRGATLWQACEFSRRQIPFVVDRNPEKVGKVMSAIGVPIISEQQARQDRPDFMLISPWFFADEILYRDKRMLELGTKAIVPLPYLRVVGYDDVFARKVAA